MGCPKQTLAGRFPTRTSPPPSSPETSPGERTLGHRRAGTTRLEPTRLRQWRSGGTHQGGRGDGGGDQRLSRAAAAAASRSHSARNLWQSTSPHPRLNLSGTSVTLDGHTLMTIRGKLIVTLEEGQKVICEEHQLARSKRGTKVTQVSTANTSR